MADSEKGFDAPHVGKAKKKGTWMPHLHIHDEHSIKDGCSTVETYGDIVVDLKGSALAITNHGQAAGFARQYFACRDRKIKPIFGMEAYVNEHRLKPVAQAIEELKKRDKAAKGKDREVKEKLERAVDFRQNKFRPSPHSILLARTRQGYRNLVKMSTDSWQRGFYYAPRTDFDFLSEHREGLVYSTACIGGFIPRIARVDFSRACEEARRIRDCFEPGSFFVELMITEYAEQRETNRMMMAVADEIGAPMIVTCDVHYARPKDGFAQDVLLLMRDKKTLKDKEAGEGIWQFEAKDLWWRTLEDVHECWKSHHADYMPRAVFREAIKNTYRLADEIEDIEFDCSLKLPGVFPEPQAGLKELVAQGLRWRADRGDIPASGYSLRDYVDRAKRELEVINGKDFAEYFLVLHDVCRTARELGARMGPGRGSAGGCLVAYLLRITEIDPLRFALLFERFLDANREDPPDIDLDFSPEHRDGIKSYVEKRYPATATIGTFSTFKPRAILQDVGRVFGLDFRDMQRLTKPLGTDADKMGWREIFEEWPDVAEWAKENREAFRVVKTLKGLISHRGKNAAGMLVAPAQALDEIPMIRDPSDGTLCTAFPDSQGDGVTYQGREITRLGYLKMDILGVRNLNVAPLAVEILERETGETVDLDALPLDDEESLRAAATGDVPGAFQLDTPTTRPILRTVGVDAFMDLVMVTALARPGPLKHNVHHQFAKLKKEGDAWKEGVPEDLVPLLKDSRGLLILQEDVMWTVQKMGGLTMGEANAVRKVIGKKLDPEAFKPWQEKFVAGGVEKGYTEEELEAVWSKIVTFASYGFNKAHSVAYMLTAYRQLYMLAHHPLPYFAALLANTPRDKSEKGVSYIRAAMGRGVPVVGPSARSGTLEFDVQGDSVRYGLSSIKGVGSGAAAVVAARPFDTMEELIERVDRRKANARVIGNMILAGALDDLTYGRDPKRDPVPRHEGIEYRNSLLARFHQIRKVKGDPEEHTTSTLMQKEKELLGLAFSWWASPVKEDLREREGLSTIATCLAEDRVRLDLLCEVSRVKTHKGRRGTMAFLDVADETGELGNVVIWSEQWDRFKVYLRRGGLVIMRLKRKENERSEYGRWSYHLSDERHGEKQDPVESVRRALRRNDD